MTAENKFYRTCFVLFYDLQLIKQRKSR